VSFNAAYGGERVTGQLYLPRGFPPPHQVVVLFPGSGAIRTSSIAEAGDLVYIDFILRSGRAVLYPVYKSTFERRDLPGIDTPAPTSQYRDHVLMWSKDLGRSIDYLETRSDLDAKALAYYGFSWGAALGAILPAVEDRIRVSILVAGGFEPTRTVPEVDAVSFAPWVKVPTLMVNGRYDGLYAVETSQLAMFRTLGTRAGDKRHVVCDSGHIPPRALMMKEVLDWLDRYLGPVDARREP
jgi:cephalosporin-C deacetylase-like acetyl esterase